MRLNVHNAASWTRLALGILLILAACTAIFFSELRTTPFRIGVATLFLAQFAVVTYRGLKAGNLKRTPNEIFQRMRQKGPSRSSRLENLSIFAGFIGAVVINWP